MPLSPFLNAIDSRGGHPPDTSSHDLVPAQPHLVIAIDQFLNLSECTQLIAAAHAVGLQPPSAADLTPRKNEAFLNRESTSFVDPLFAECLWRRLRPHLPDVDGRTPVGLYADGPKQECSRFKLYRYAKVRAASSPIMYAYINVCYPILSYNVYARRRAARPRRVCVSMRTSTRAGRELPVRRLNTRC